jgi:hypothetical protein
MWTLSLIGFGLAFMLYALVRFLRDAKRNSAGRRMHSPEFGGTRQASLAGMISKQSARKHSSETHGKERS